MAAYERRRIVARLRAGREVKASQHPGARSQGGKLPHGYRRGKRGMVEIDPEQAAEVRRAFELIRDGKSIRNAAEIMSTETGRLWRSTTMARIVSREVYKLGEPGRIIDPRLWNATQAALSSRRKR